ncbi:hypothetical protein SCATT_23020 [Streptantibioticus cattleyicolor NRRL 8057 = DSM 46488]|uniref:Uncharacterized protein n=1 Tax=Streptantibioticus cattleyicolor (strain ATCC 35852 / DSM 46488 / JCM 4925 / NBRC 14057 / NRRL 8057) TaxID=1003195 RepID=G8WQE2_STREN|nr:hypothetical protein SCATT_23020 [Streptantibioticus cattleyicolor NRRL 8057 = DSM 46488]
MLPLNPALLRDRVRDHPWREPRDAAAVPSFPSSRRCPVPRTGTWRTPPDAARMSPEPCPRWPRAPRGNGASR